MDKGRTLTARLLEKLADSIIDIGESYTGVCNSGMAASTTTIVCDDLKDFDDDYFNDGWLMYIAHNDDAPGTAPEGETRDISNYVGATGTFTTAAFSANVEESDVVIVARVTTFIIDQVKLIASPVDGSLASFISSGNGSTTLGTRLGVDVSIIDVLGHTGVAALTTGIYGNLGDFAGQTNLQTLLTALGIPDVAAKPLYTCLVTDRLDDGTFGLAALNTDLDAILANQAGSETISSTNLPNDVAENTIIEISTGLRQTLDSVWLDFVNLVQDVTIKVYHKIDGINYRLYDTYSWSTVEDDGILIRDITINNDWKLTVTSTVAQGGIKAIPYNIIITPME